MKSTIPKEKIALHLNTDILLTGETIFYKLFCLLEGANTQSGISKMAYVELIGSEKNSLFRHKLKLSNGLSNGHFFIPANVKTGHYKLVGYTQWMKNNPKNRFVQKDVYILNPYVESSNLQSGISEENNLGIVQIKKTGNKNLVTNASQSLSLKTDSEVYRPRNKVALKINNLLGVSGYGNYSLSVRKLDDAEVETKQNDALKNGVNTNSSFYLPELRGEILSGHVVSKGNDMVAANKIIALSILGKNYVYKNVMTDEFGRFYFNVYESYTNSNAVLQLLDANNENFKIILDDKLFNYFEALKFKKIHLNENIKDWLVRKSIANQIENAYNSSKLDSTIYRNPAKSFYGKPTITYKLDDYKRFPTIRETFVEVIEGAGIREGKEGYSFKVYYHEDFDTNPFSGFEPLVLVDGLMIKDNQRIIDFSPYKIEDISYAQGIHFYGPSIFNGIIDFRTKNGDFYVPTNGDGLNDFELDIPQENKKYYHPNYDKEAAILKRIPDYRHQLLWKPDIALKSNMGSLEFYTSDVEGVYEMVLEGYTLNGNYINSKGYFEVKHH
ncbi:hypothetical protein [Algibacter sp. 2305UL17-15]|uniref:hypothetical protein n=1 Tax=Algibacter sp. 2305UL17-15 TaxID=3231268 RepID=UPI00345AFD6F